MLNNASCFVHSLSCICFMPLDQMIWAYCFILVHMPIVFVWVYICPQVLTWSVTIDPYNVINMTLWPWPWPFGCIEQKCGVRCCVVGLIIIVLYSCKGLVKLDIWNNCHIQGFRIKMFKINLAADCEQCESGQTVTDWLTFMLGQTPSLITTISYRVFFFLFQVKYVACKQFLPNRH